MTTVACGLCGNREGDLIAIGLKDGDLIYLCRHGHIDAVTYDIRTGLFTFMTSNGNKGEATAIYRLLLGAPDSPCEFNGLSEMIDNDHLLD